ncbi:MAG: tyrosine-type recombinase/integrase [Sulfuricaulis sp.]
MSTLTDVKIRNLKPKAKAFQAADGNGLVLEVRPNGQKAWLYRYRLYGRQEKLSIGSYPDLSLAEARSRHVDARQMVLANKSPAQTKQAEKRRLSDDLQIVRGLAKAYIDDHISKLASAKLAEAWITKHILPAIGSKFIHEVIPADCIAVVEKIKRRGAPAVARKVLEQLRGIFGYAVDHHLLTLNPAAQVRAAKIIGVKQARNRYLKTSEIKRFVKALDSFPTAEGNRIAFKLILLTLCRKGELVQARWEHIDLKRGEWRIPSANAKNRNEHIVYLSRQARELFRELQTLAGESPWVLPGRDLKHHISFTTLNQATFVLRRQGEKWAWLADVHIHDLRRTASTHLHEAGFVSDIIEKSLNHSVAGVRGVYNKAMYADQRREMLQQWSDMVDAWTTGAEVVPMRARVPGAA